MEETAHQIYGDAFYGESYGTRHTKRPPRRGPHHAETVGTGMGGGQEVPTPVFHATLTGILLAQLVSQKPFQRLAGFINGMFQSYAPLLHGYYRSTMEALYDWNPNLPRHFNLFTSVFAAATFNFGPRTITFPHLDFANLAWGWCSITALGLFNPDKGGHLILWDLRLVIRFPPGSTIFIPSAILRHSNVAIQEGETRYSFTQFTPAGIFRFLYNGCKTEKSVNERCMTAAEKSQRAQDRVNCWSDGLKMFSTWDVAFE
ncbi:hypothetical protein B0H15DRAFT_793381 [Mycena belliarum]|uniref:Uncharacterized protein n=1 Tax=Mycena belliarum TaxID=1033014 RepID=A0AAD6TM52_9AGAR|nr:hypothetical protein B0H15DRAFT_793381 [Mycena belliae]